jgi:hypothetical protein
MQMNRDNIAKMAVYLDGLDDGEDSNLGFDMRNSLKSATNTIHACGTAACLGGHLQHLFPELRQVSLQNAISTHFEVSYLVADQMAYPQEGEGEDEDESKAWEATPAEAAAMLRGFTVSGEVFWA